MAAPEWRLQFAAAALIYTVAARSDIAASGYLRR
ncbi:MAG: hypothetical protein ACI83P_002782 [Janthinobacterium sp.]|jgi:hypothetical protein